MNHPSPLALWQSHPDLRMLVDSVAAAGGEVRIVGGAVRDFLLQRPVGDIDLATNLPPPQLIAALAQAAIKFVPTGIAHGTVTAILNRQPYEVTSLRRDLASDGRHAQVQFTDDWQADAARRDFTFNALYVAAEGRLYDYFAGQADLAQGRVRFIGDASARIREDVLRILRFYRFYAWFGRGAPDAAALAACRELAPLLPQLSVERVWREIGKLLLAADPVPVWRLMLENQALAVFLPEATRLERLAALIALEQRCAIAPAGLRRLAALLPPDTQASAIGRRLKLSGREAETLTCLLEIPPLLPAPLPAKALWELLYKYGAERMRDGVLLAAADDRFDPVPALAIIDGWPDPVFPLRGEDLRALGMPPGPAMGVLLKAVEAWWIAEDFQPAHDACLAEAKRRLGAGG